MSVTDTHIGLISTKEEETAHLGHLLGMACRAGDCITLEGDLGTGKTVLCRGFIQAAAGSAVDVTSPTFTLVQIYETRHGVPLWHMDFYRLENKDEVMETGLEEALEHAMTLIEWPQVASTFLPHDRLQVRLTHGKEGDVRTISLQGNATRWQACLSDIMEAYERNR
ncbi:MAG: tRNA (adenosine(37)-N6)-threonylcarbamoyltransferase complex ATPase subunit type 1 TsaE [Alphaproteobacteria bacterium]